MYLGVLLLYRVWWLRFFLIALVIFIPVGLIEVVANRAFETLNPDRGIETLALLSTGAVTFATSMLGEVFLAGVIGVSLAHAREGRFPPVAHLARQIRYLRLVVLDLVSIALIVAGAMLLLIPGLLVYVYLGLAGPVVEIEHHRVWGAFRRSASLVRLDFWLVFWVLLPAGVVSNALSSGLEHLVTGMLGHSELVSGLASAVSEAVFSPLYAIAAGLLTLQLIERKAASGAPAPTPTAAS